MTTTSNGHDPQFIYGSNPDAGGYFQHEGLKLYYEVYGAGPDLLLIHGNASSIWGMKPQIEYFSRHYRVIVMDSRDHGRSADAPGPLTFEAMADDLAALLDHVHAGPALVLGYSDGGIQALLLGLRHPGKVAKIAAMAANLNPHGYVPTPSARAGGRIVQIIKPPVANLRIVRMIRRRLSAEPAYLPARARRVAALDREQPHIKPSALHGIKAPTLVLAADHDLIADGHTLEIYHHIPNGQLAIFPNATHAIPFEDPQLFNETVDRFFRRPYAKIDRLPDTMKSLERIKAEYAAEHERVTPPQHRPGGLPSHGPSREL
ncbi:MAG TPA: alpha/beta hydrolase [Steroidobacteraceae bacterium]|nr:alpha/beta hydrolase [Steroidobacteraceae bacterium]